jgi:ParB family chromosome partitioning protein
MARLPPKLSGLIKTGAVVPTTPFHELPDIGHSLPGSATAEPEKLSSSPVDKVPAELVMQPALDGSRTLHVISVHLIDPNPLAPREVYTHQMILERAQDLRSQGQHDPIHVIPNPDTPGRFIICDGWTRVQACLVHKVLDGLLAEVHAGLSLQEAAWFGYEQNEGRQQHCDFDRAMFYEKLIAEGMNASDIARRAKLDRSMMSFYRSYAKLPDDVLQIVRMHPAKFGSRVAYELNKLNEVLGTRKTVALATKFADEDQPVRWLQNQVQAHLHPTPHKGPAPLKHVRYANGYYKQRETGFEVSIDVPAEKREAFAQALENLLDTVAIQAPKTTKTPAKTE